MQRGIFYGLAAYGLWGLLPIYWKLLAAVPAMEILAHRILWSLLFCALILWLKQGFAWLPELRKDKRSLWILIFASLLLGFNWGLFIWAVTHGHIVETSLGYFITPLVSVALGLFVLHERIFPIQWLAIALASVGVCSLVLTQDQVPWIALSLAFSFGTYGLLKKQLSLPALQSLSFETALMLPPACAYLLWLLTKGELYFARDALESLELVGGGIATAMPLLFFAAAARRIPLSLLGLLQYLAPTMQFCIGVFVYREAFSQSRLLGFLFIWSGLAVLALRALHRRGKTRPATRT